MFRTDNEGCTTALVVGGIILVVSAVLVEVPLRSSIAGASWDLTRRLLQNPDDGVRKGTADEVQRVSAPATC